MEILIGSFSLRTIALHDKRAAKAKMRECTDRLVQHKPRDDRESFETPRPLRSLMRSQIGFATHKNRIHGGPDDRAQDRYPKLIRRGVPQLSMPAEGFPLLSASLARRE